MRLAPECVRLRRMAKAHAAGEMSQAEYRAARREVIDGFPGTPPADDDTRPRFADEPTLRSDSRMSGHLGVAAEASSGAAPDRRWLWLAAGVVILVAALLTLPTAAAGAAAARPTEAARVPPVRERHPDPVSSPRLEVSSVVVEWGEAAAAADADLNLAPLQRQAEQALTDVRTRNAPGQHGFTPTELEEVARFLNVLGVHEGAGGLDAEDARDLSALIREQKRRRGVSVAQLEAVARSVQSRLRESGYFVGAAYLPAQTVTDGRVRIEVLPGRLGDIVVAGGDPGPVSGTFAPLLGQPLTLDGVSRHLQRLNSLPGFTAQASFGPGAEVGEAQLQLNLLERRRWSAAVEVDNHGDAATGEQRLSITGSWLNPRGVGDRLSAGALASLNPANQTYGYVEYDMPLGEAFRLSGRIGNNDFSRDGVPELDGGGTVVDLVARRNLLHGRERSATAVFSATRQHLDYDAGLSQTVTAIGAGIAGHRVWNQPRIAADAGVNLQWGHIGGDTFTGQEDRFWLLEMDAEAWLPLSLPGLAGEHKLRGYVSGQWSDSLLPATRRFALAGAARARAFDRSAFLGDRGVLLGLELRVPVAVGELLLFTESGYGDGRADGAETWAQLTNIGLGWDAELSAALTSRLSWALPVAAEGSDDFDDDGSRWYWSVRYEH
jgi:hemolysin activation/secretion protein